MAEIIKRIGDEIIVPVSVAGVYDMYGIGVDVTYNPAILEPVMDGENLYIEDRGFLNNPTILAGIKQDQDGNDIPGTLVIAANMPSEAANGSGDIFVIKFRALTSGTTDILFDQEYCNLFDENDSFPANWEEQDNLNILQTAMVTLRIE